MATKPVARRGDSGSHGGTIISGNETFLVNGKPVAHVGDSYACPKHGKNPIITGSRSIYSSKKVAHVGSRTACGAVIITGSPDTFVDDQTPQNVAVSEEYLFELTFVEFQLLNEMEEPIPHEEYLITLADGSTVDGTLDENGFVRLDNVPCGTSVISFPNLEDYVGN